MFPQIFGKYVLEREIAAGGMARVYLATLRGAVGFEKRLVVKQIRSELASDPAFVTRFVEEAKTAVELSHPNIVPVYELGVEQGVYYIAMELCEGLTLSEVLSETGPLGPAEGAHVGAEICRALDYAHRRAKIVHRDVTPRNVLIDEEGGVRLIDFGIAAPTLSSNGKHSEVFGSPGHMPPEQLRGAELSPASDVFAVGVLLIEAWTGYPPFRRATVQESEHALFSSAPPDLGSQEPSLAPLNRLIASCVALDARQRPSAAERLARPLREFLKTEDSADVARRLGERVRNVRRRARSSSPRPFGEDAASGMTAQARPLEAQSEAARQSPATNGQAITRTFAARDEVEVWTRKLSSAPPPGKEAASPERILASGTPSAAPRESASAATLPRRSRYRTLALVAALGGVALGSVHWLRSASPRLAPRLPATPIAAPRSAVPSSQPIVKAAPAVGPTLRRLPISRHAHNPKPEPSAAQHAAPLLSAEPEQFGELKITADPRAQVAVSGAHFQTLGQSPLLGLKLPIGAYQIVFRNDTYGTPLNTRVIVVAGVSRSVHADFRLAEPAVSVR